MTQPQNPLEPLVRSIVEQAVTELRKQLQAEPAVKPRLLSAAQTAQYLGRSTDAIYNMLSTGKLKRVAIDGRAFFDVVDLDRLIEKAKEEENDIKARGKDSGIQKAHRHDRHHAD